MSTPKIVIKGIDAVIKRDLEKHKVLLQQSQTSLTSFKEGRTHEVRRKRHYRKQIGNGKYNDESLKKSIKDINVNIRHMSDKVKMAEDQIEHHTRIINHLEKQLKQYDEDMKELAQSRKK